MSYYADKIVALRDVFGDDAVEVTPEVVRCGNRQYPVVDDVIILLPPAQWPESLRRRLDDSTFSQARSSVPAADIQRTFGAEWQTYGAVLAEHEDEFRRYFDLVDLSGLAGERVADLGCGSGRWSYYLHSKCREILLVDFSEAIFVARENLRAAKNALFFMGDVTALPFRPDFCDFLFSLGVLHHLPMPCLEVVRSFRPSPPGNSFFCITPWTTDPPISGSCWHWSRC